MLSFKSFKEMKGWFLPDTDDNKEWRWLIMFLLNCAQDKTKDLYSRKFFLWRVETHFNEWKNGKSAFRVARLEYKIKRLRKKFGLTEPLLTKPSPTEPESQSKTQP